MSVTLELVVDDEIAVYLQDLAVGQGRTPEEVAALLVTDEVRREQAIDAELIARLGHQPAVDDQRLGGFGVDARTALQAASVGG